MIESGELPYPDASLFTLRQAVNGLSVIALVWVLLANVPLEGQVNGGVDIRSAEKVFVAKDTPALLLKYRYDFPGRQIVYIKGLGVVPARGEFEYLTRESVLQVLDRPDGAILLNVPLKETVVVASIAPLQYVPAEKDFPEPFKSATWSKSLSQVRLHEIMDKYFLPMPREKDGLSYICTTFMPLQVDKLPPGTTAQLALLISYPHGVDAGENVVHIQMLVEEGRMLSDHIEPTSNQNIENAAEKFVDKLVSEIKAAQDHQ